MGQRGPAPKPDFLKLLHGNPGRRPLGRGLNLPPVEKLDPPAHFNSTQLQMWEEVTETMAKAGGLVIADRLLLARYVALLCEYRKAESWMAENSKGQVAFPINDAAGKTKNMKTFSQLESMLKISNHLLRIEQQLGLTPSARASWGNQKPSGGGDDERDDFLDR